MIRGTFHDNWLGSGLGGSPGLSDDAQLSRRGESVGLGGSPSITHGKAEQAFLKALWNIFRQAGGPGWDGYDASPVNAAAIAYASQFLSELPSDIIPPEIAADADGDVSLDWDFGPRNTFSVRISRDGTVYFAGLFGHSTYHGSETLSRGLPKSVAEGIRRAIRESQH